MARVPSHSGLTPVLSFHTLPVVRRSFAILLGCMLSVTSGQVPALHVHAYIDHDHPEHHHGLAAHDHAPPVLHHSDAAPRLESCDPGEHVVSLVLGCAPLPDNMVITGVCPRATAIASLVPLRSVGDVTDVRVHGPPSRTQLAPRAPPLRLPA